MHSSDHLHLYEEILLLALKDAEGTIASGTMYHFAIGGAILAELLLTKQVALDEKKKVKVIPQGSDLTIDDSLLKECLQKIASSKRPKVLQTWVSHFANLKNLKHRVAGQLVQKGILKADEDKILLIFTRKIYPEINHQPEQQLIDRLQDAIFTNTENIDPRTVVLISLANNTGLLKTIFDKKDLKTRKERIKKIVNGEVAGKATKDAIDAMMAAVAITAIVPTIVATAATS
jgi:Golgi phosphoprotein 3